MKKLLVFILSVIILSVNLYSKIFNYDIFFNKSPYNDSLDLELINIINQAQSTIDAHFYDIDRDNIVNAFSAAADRGVKIRIITDSDNWSSQCDTLNSNVNINVINDKKTTGNTNGSRQSHNKFAVFDYTNSTSPVRNYVWTGSYNITDTGTEDNANNVIVIKENNNTSLAAAYTTEFNEMWGTNIFTFNSNSSKFGSEKTDNTTHLFSLGSGINNIECYFSPSDNTAQHIVNAVNSANYNIFFCIFTFTTGTGGQIIFDAMNSKNSMGLSVKGVFDAFQSNPQYINALNQGWDVYKDALSGLLHHKYMIIDYGHPDSDPIVITGSHNWTDDANNKNDENTLIIHDNDIVNAFFKEFYDRFTEAGGYLPLNTPPVKNFIAYPSYPDGIRLKWTNPDDDFFKEVKIYYNTTGYPETISEGIFLTNVAGTKNENKSILVHNNFSLHTRYYFTAFVYNEANNSTNSYTSCIYISPEDTGSISDNFITENNDYKNIEIYFQTESPDKVYIYNTTGNLVKEIDSFDNKKFIWDLKCNDEISVGSGLYFLVYYLNGERKTKKILVAR